MCGPDAVGTAEAVVHVQGRTVGNVRIRRRPDRRSGTDRKVALVQRAQTDIGQITSAEGPLQACRAKNGLNVALLTRLRLGRKPVTTPTVNGASAYFRQTSSMTRYVSALR